MAASQHHGAVNSSLGDCAFVVVDLCTAQLPGMVSSAAHHVSSSSHKLQHRFDNAYFQSPAINTSINTRELHLPVSLPVGCSLFIPMNIPSSSRAGSLRAEESDARLVS